MKDRGFTECTGSWTITIRKRGIWEPWKFTVHHPELGTVTGSTWRQVQALRSARHVISMTSALLPDSPPDNPHR